MKRFIGDQPEISLKMLANVSELCIVKFLEVNSQRCGLGWREDEATKNCYRFHSRRTTFDCKLILQFLCFFSLYSKTEFSFCLCFHICSFPVQ